MYSCLPIEAHKKADIAFAMSACELSYTIMPDRKRRYTEGDRGMLLRTEA